MKIKLVADSSANLTCMPHCDYSFAPLKVIAGDREFTDNAEIDVPFMLQKLKAHKGPTSTACPSVQDWLEAFGDADLVLGVSITSALSGCFNTASIAAREYMAANPGKKVFILDSLTTGPEMELILEKYQELVLQGRSFDFICSEIQQYLARTHLIFSLASLSNFAKNGRVSQATAAAVGFLGIRIVGRASDQGALEPLHKCRGEKKALHQLLHSMLEAGYCGGRVRISHTNNSSAATEFSRLLKEKYPGCDLKIRENRGLCSYYAEEGGLLIGYEI